MHVAALYRYPVKGFEREACESLRVLPGGRIAGDRVLSLRLAGTEAADDAWASKTDCVALVNTPGLAPLRLRLDHEALRLQVRLGDALLFDDALDVPGRARFAAAMTAYLQGLEVSAIARPDRLPLRLVGDGRTPRYQDRPPGYVSLHARASVAEVADALGEAPELAERRFRSNIALDGLEAWADQDLVGRRLRIGTVELRVEKPVVRCLATHANPATGERDRAVMQTLLALRPGDQRPTFAVLTTAEEGGEVRVGDEVVVLA